MKHEELIRIDCLGDMCPVPIIKLQKREGELSKGRQIVLITDHSCVSESVKNYCNVHRYKVKILEPVNGVWEFYISKKPND
ncbi:sulfurtransferase TusA family protein [Sinanaerobacter chloroacetimidivorans]|uniref:sulfurtransferase TusA family protein n=1 Tax=Sinanaerobacter chloroacetimidivorans TaxID=2818044 RepID=UPI001D05A692|nr:sulfurtransferase TusA family protein [Sinanaerobacter chloroacetimidivorans]